MNLKDLIPTAPEVIREGVIVIGGILIAALILSRFPKVKAFVAANSITVKDDQSKLLF